MALSADADTTEDEARPEPGVAGSDAKAGPCWGTEGWDGVRPVALRWFRKVDALGVCDEVACPGEASEVCEEGAAALEDESGIRDDGEEVAAGYAACPAALRLLALLVSVWNGTCPDIVSGLLSLMKRNFGLLKF